VVQASLRPWRDWLGGAAFEWEGGPAPAILDRGRLAEALGNLVANAAEHGAGEVQVRGRRTARGVRIEVRNRVAAAGAVRSGGSASAQPRLGARPLAPPRLGAGPRSRDLARFPFRARPGSRPLVRPLFGAGLRSRPLALRPYRDRGRGLAIASRAARDLGGRLLLSFDGERAVAVLELPAAALAPSAGPSGAETA